MSVTIDYYQESTTVLPSVASSLLHILKVLRIPAVDAVVNQQKHKSPPQQQ